MGWLLAASATHKTVQQLVRRTQAASPSVQHNLSCSHSSYKLCRHRQNVSQGFGERRVTTPPKADRTALLEADKRWKLEPYDRPEWEAWLQEQRQTAGVKSGNLYLQVGYPDLDECMGCSSV